MNKELPKAYEPSRYEEAIYKEWEKSGFFNPDNLSVDKNAPAYAIVMPPPNVTGTLHMGHAAMLALEDILIRYHRMCGNRTLWVPGADHAAIATQTKVEKIIKAEGTDRHQLGRDKFLERVREFAQNSHDTIVNQVKKMGSSCDWSREAYTLDEVRSKAVRSVFKLMYDDGLIYRGERIVNWCPRCHSTLADDEVEYKTKRSTLYTFRYGKDFPFLIASTRPETKLGDTAVAVNPKDKRYRDFIGKTYTVDFVGIPLKLKVIADREVDMNFGTGALGVTPAHAAVDWQMAEANGLPVIKVIDEDGLIHPGFKEFSGKTALAARDMIVKKLRERDLLVKEEEIENNLSLCYRCDTPVEPLPSLQWFIDVNKKLNRKSQIANHKSLDWNGKSIKEVALDAVRSGKIKIVPERFEKNYYHWMENLRDWCISRQIWFGHQVPVWYRSQKSEVRSKKFIDLNFREKEMFEAVKNGSKTVETRALNPEEPDRYFGDLQAGDMLVLNYLENDNIKESLKTEIESAKIYQNVKGLIKDYDIDKIIPGGRQEDITEFYESIPGYAEKVEANGLIAIELGEIKPFNGDHVYLTIVRHGQTDWNRQGLMQGQTDVPLNEKGRADAKKLGRKIGREKFDIVITSPLKRTSETARYLNSFGVEMIEDDRLKERYYGKFEGLKTGEVLKEHPEIKTFSVNGLPYWIEVPTAETYDEVRKRVADFIEDLKGKYAGKRVLVVSHGDTLDMFYAILNDLPNEKAYGRFSLNMRLEKYELAAGAGKEVYIGVEPPAGDGWTQDTDTLDTWFSSGLWTFTTLVRTPGQIRAENGRLIIDSDDFQRFHPTAVLETGYDILFFWVARMIIMTTYAVGDIPFRDVYLHGLVLDEHGKKMSKSKGNVIDPLDMIAKYGTDATRLSLVIGSTPGNDLRLSEEKIAGFRNFANKLWNVARFVSTKYEVRSMKSEVRSQKYELNVNNLSMADRWIMLKMRYLIKEVTDDLDHYRFSQAGERLRAFTWDELADWYLEVSKFETDGVKAKIMARLLPDLLKLWHPFIPFVTEAIWRETGNNDFLMVQAWPRAEDYDIAVKDNNFETIKNIIIAVRNARSENRVEPSRKIKAVIYAGKDAAAVRSQTILIENLRTGISELEVKDKGDKIANAIFVTVNGYEIYLIGAVDAAKEKERLGKEIASLEKIVAVTQKKLASEEFVAKAPAAVVNKEKDKLTNAQSELAKLQKQLKLIK